MTRGFFYFLYFGKKVKTQQNTIQPANGTRHTCHTFQGFRAASIPSDTATGPPHTPWVLEYASNRGGNMKLIRVSVVVVAGCLLLSACAGNSDKDRAQGFAIKACDIQTDEGGEPLRNSDGVVPFDDSIGTGLTNVETDPIPEIQSQFEGLSDLSSSAQAAAQLDPTWRSLADGLALRVSILSVSVSARKRGENPFDRTVTNSDVSNYNQAVSEWKQECSGLATLLSE